MPRNGTIEETPGYCKTEDLANLFALSSQSISQLTRNGVLKKRDTPAGKRYNVVESTRTYVQYLRDKAAGHRTLRHTLRTVLRSYDSPARGGLQYPLSPGARGKYGESASKQTNFSHAEGIARSMYADKSFPGAVALYEHKIHWRYLWV